MIDRIEWITILSSTLLQGWYELSRGAALRDLECRMIADLERRRYVRRLGTRSLISLSGETRVLLELTSAGTAAMERWYAGGAL